MKKSSIFILLLAMLQPAFAASKQAAASSKDKAKKCIVLETSDLYNYDWATAAPNMGFNTISTGTDVLQPTIFLRERAGKLFLRDCKARGIEVEHQLHAIDDLLPRTLFTQDSTMFRMDKDGRRRADYNLCYTSPAAQAIIAKRVVRYAKQTPSTDHRYYFWLDEGADGCHCPECSKYTRSELNLMITNVIAKALRAKYDPEAMVAHLAYYNTYEAPRQVKPAEGVFLEFSSYLRSWAQPLKCDTATARFGYTNGKILQYLKDNLEVFPASTAEVIEYWIDAAYQSNYRYPYRSIIWMPKIIKQDVKTYNKLGIHRFNCFAAGMDSTYFQQHPVVKEQLKQFAKMLK
ncbi:MAG: DUF4838 domain-containing protein [Prevotellaceae bacterium]|nr:DUF4838 domain-containing protein [Prevotellaceae bacterium]MDY3856603.1 DUF4838 domain-containing protein [Bacteroidaceae bacterium]